MLRDVQGMVSMLREGHGVGAEMYRARCGCCGC